MFSLFLATMAAAAATAPADNGPKVASSTNGEFISSHYPARALRAGEQGKVGFRITVEPSGSLGSCEITQSSGFQALDDETCELIVRYARLKPVRNEEGRTVRATHLGYINWRLPEGATKVAANAPGKTDKRDRIVCKRETRTGSLVTRTRQCLTSREWVNQERYWQDELDRIQGRGFNNGNP